MAKHKSGRNVNGILLLDKRRGVSSNRALQEVRHLLDAKKAGHTGSLDPLATGLLPLCFGEATKVSGLILDDNKRYQATIQLGVKTDTGDAEGNVLAEIPVPEISEWQLRDCLQSFLGNSKQVPPMHSALKLQGRKLYELARQGITVDRPTRPICIHALNLLDFDGVLVTVEVSCSKGTYIRSLAEDIAQRLGCCGSLAALRRTAVGPFSVCQAYSLEHLQAMNTADLSKTLLATDTPLADFPAVAVSEEQSDCIKHGRQIVFTASFSGTVRIYYQHTFLGLGEMSINGKLLPKKLFHSENQAT